MIFNTMTKQLRILITGASSGIGRALTEHYAAQGQIVGAIARREDIINQLAQTHSTIIPLPADVTDAPAMEQAIGRFALETGGLDIVYANAGIGQKNPQDAWEPDHARNLTNINVLGTLNTITPSVQIMIEQQNGHLVGISSLAAHTPLPHAASYGASKKWMNFYLQSLAMDLEQYNIKCTVVMPGHVSTAMVDGEDKVGLITPGAKRAAKLIANKVAQGQTMIRFPRKMALLTQIAACLPKSIRANMQRKRLQKRKTHRGE